MRPGQMYEMTGTQTAEPYGDLDVEDIVKLAQAGIKMEFADIKHRIKQPKPPQKQYKYNNIGAHLLEPLIARIINNLTATKSNYYGLTDGETLPFSHLSATAHGDMVHVFVHIHGLRPYVVEDHKSLYPSDQLIASIMLNAKLHEDKANKPQDEQSAPQTAAYPRQQGKTLMGAYGGASVSPRAG